MTDFFISYTHVDTAWAEWISYVLEEEGFSTIVQAWDFRPGSNFVLEMQRASAEADRTLMVLSPDYLKSQFASPEWAAAFSADPQGLNLKLVPVQVRPCSPTGLLASIIQIRIAGIANDTVARKVLLAGVDQKRAKPSSRPPFPGASLPEQKAFPGATSMALPQQTAALSVLPRLNRIPTDVEKRRFVRSGFEAIKGLFESNLQKASQEEARIETDFQLRTATDFRAEIFLDGSSKCVCRIWQGGMYSENNICYGQGRSMPDNSCNEIITLSEDQNELSFKATMAMGASLGGKEFNTKRMTATDTAEYLWSCFVARLEG